MKQKLPKLTKSDLESYLNYLEKKSLRYRAEIIIGRDIDYAQKQLKKLDQMAITAISRYYN